MTTQEFSDSFDTLLNTYNTQSRFGEAASKAEIALDEYEKSVFLTQAQDQIVKSYFNARNNASIEGFDDTERRQIDFSTLITKVSIPTPYNTLSYSYKDMSTGTMGSQGDNNKWAIKWTIEASRSCYLVVEGRLSNSDNILPPSNKNYTLSITEHTTSTNIHYLKIEFDLYFNDHTELQDSVKSVYDTEFTEFQEELAEHGFKFSINSYNKGPHDMAYTDLVFPVNLGTLRLSEAVSIESRQQEDDHMVILGKPEEANTYVEPFDDRGILYKLPENILFILNEKLNIPDNVPSNFVVKPMHYREYDREMSKAYAQPLKKQIWRLFNNSATGFDLMSELIPSEALYKKLKRTNSYYTVRYVRRPTPIILTDLPNGLNIDGVSEETQCALNPILHMDILNEAFRLAVTTRGGTPGATQQRAAANRNREE